MLPYVLVAKQNLKDWPGAAKKMSGEAAAEIALAKIRGGYKKQDPSCPKCFVKLPKGSRICTFCE